MIFYYLFSNFPFCQTQYLSFLLSSFLNVVFLPFPAAAACFCQPLHFLGQKFQGTHGNFNRPVCQNRLIFHTIGNGIRDQVIAF